MIKVVTSSRTRSTAPARSEGASNMQHPNNPIDVKLPSHVTQLTLVFNLPQTISPFTLNLSQDHFPPFAAPICAPVPPPVSVPASASDDIKITDARRLDDAISALRNLDNRIPKS